MGLGPWLNIDMSINHLLARLHNRYAFLRRRLEKKLLHKQEALSLFRACHRVNPKQIQHQTIADTRFVVIDTETTGLHVYSGDEIIDIALIELQGLETTGRCFQSYINPQREIPAASTAIHHIYDSDVAHAPTLEQLLPQVMEFIGDAVLVGHHVNFDIRFLNKTLQKVCHGLLQNPNIDTMLLFLEYRGQIGHYTLEEVAKHCNVHIRGRHSAQGDAEATCRIFQHLAPQLISLQENVSRLLKAQYQTRSQL